ncbi:class I SAM-dependent methyltransferase [Chelatococcus asaccharovorans]|uniref:class I SAM-dependent methyltransferase n=1 Tax=Chelatococcus asaccharovorans TaxID=28210 RepID=UPI00224C7052|nr:class I SAM-dependent methyltransferase [Chelatococcus asaccharovorans]CAH1661397.1 SAM-dependent methyltransferase [Chelatococcus asaccharovorans]CAH1689793.1 SAM-dependent methyltransferase [Chelatococcus asaccharovorans]
MTETPTPGSGALPGADLSTEKMPGHWLLARLGKRVLRPGGLELTGRLLSRLNVGPTDDVVELAPGLGVTAGLILEKKPASYRGVERDEGAAAIARTAVGTGGEVSIGHAEATGLPDGSASVVIGEAMLTMQPQAHKQAIVAEAARLLRPGGRYGVHELAIVPDDVPAEIENEIARALSGAIHVGARPLTEAAWRSLFEASGFAPVQVDNAPMHLLEPRRLIADEGLGRALLFATRVLLQPDARKRVLTMRRIFRTHGRWLRAIAIVAEKPMSGEATPQ